MLKRSAIAALIFTGLIFTGLTSSAFAQENFGAKPSADLGIYSNANQQMMLRQSMNNDAKSNVTPEQMRRAHKAVAMIKANQCQDAYNMALSENDNRLALNIAVACKAQIRQ